MNVWEMVDYWMDGDVCVCVCVCLYISMYQYMCQILAFKPHPGSLQHSTLPASYTMRAPLLKTVMFFYQLHQLETFLFKKSG